MNKYLVGAVVEGSGDALPLVLAVGEGDDQLAGAVVLWGTRNGIGIGVVGRVVAKVAPSAQGVGVRVAGAAHQGALLEEGETEEEQGRVAVVLALPVGEAAWWKVNSIRAAY